MVDVSRIKGPGQVQTPDPHDRARMQERDFQRTMRQEYLKVHHGERSRGRSATGFGGRFICSGPRAADAMRFVQDLHRGSPTFRRALDESLRNADTVWITLGYGGGNSRSTIGARDEKIYINLNQGDLFDLVLHECGHALAKLPDGPLGGVGPNQRFQAQVKRELEKAGGLQAYGYEVKPHEAPPREG
jgi:hypothetical protein